MMWIDIINILSGYYIYFAVPIFVERSELTQLTDLKIGKIRKIFKDRFWGDWGFIHLCFDIRGMEALKTECEAAGFPFTVDSGDTFDMGEAGGRFSYIAVIKP